MLFDSLATYDGGAPIGLLSYGGAPGIAHSWAELSSSSGSILFTDAPDDDGVAWLIEDLGGWDSADVRFAATDRPQADGVFVTTPREGARRLDLVGHLFADTADEAFAAKTRLASIVRLRQELTLVVHE